MNDTQEEARIAVIVDSDARARGQLAASFNRDWRVLQCPTVATASSLILIARPRLVVVELQLDDGSGYDIAQAAFAHDFTYKLVLLSTHLSVAAVVRAHALRFASVALKPTTATELLAQLGSPPHVRDSSRSMSLERALWEYMSRYVMTLPTRRAAATQLGLHPRSLRRMLARNPPTH